MKAIIKLDVPEWQIGEEVFVYFPDTMCRKAICELDTSAKTPIWCDERFSIYQVENTKE